MIKMSTKQCAICDFDGREEEVVLHYLNHHLPAKKVPFLCVACAFWSNTRGQAWRHCSRQHWATQEEQLEDMCLGTFTPIDLQTMVVQPRVLRQRPRPESSSSYNRPRPENSSSYKRSRPENSNNYQRSQPKSSSLNGDKCT